MLNAHDHLKYNQNLPGGQNAQSVTNPRYDHCNIANNAFNDPACAHYRYDRRKGLNGKVMITAKGNDDDEVVTWNELRHLISGVMTIAGSGGSKGLLRNVDIAPSNGDRYDYSEGLTYANNKRVGYDTFPLGDYEIVTEYSSGCEKYPTVPSDEVLNENLIFLPHVSEGINSFSENEFNCLTGVGSNNVDLKSPKSTFIHGIAMTESMVKALGVDSQLGDIQVGYWADVLIVKVDGEAGYEDLVALTPDSILMSFRAGKPLFGYSSLMKSITNECEYLSAQGMPGRQVCIKSDTGYSLDDLYKINKGFFALYQSTFDSSSEPSCTPARYGEYSGQITTSDKDGDAILNDRDNCPLYL